MENFIVGVVSGIVATIVITLSVLTYHRIGDWLNFRPFYKIWAPFADSSTIIALTGKQQGHTLKVSINETDAAKHIQKLLSRSPKVQIAVSDDEILPLEGSNVITLGSEHVNEITRSLLASVAGSINYSYTADNNLIVNGEFFKSIYEDNVLIEDYALVCKAVNPFSDRHKFIALAGNHGIGTQGAVIAITTKKLADSIIREVGKSDFFAIIKTQIDKRFGRTPTNVEVVRCGFIIHGQNQHIQTLRESRDQQLISFLRELGINEQYLGHAQKRACLALKICNAIQSQGTDIDIDAVYFGIMLHDIGRVESNEIDHGLRGVALLIAHRKDFEKRFFVMPDTFLKIIEAIECHILGGIRKQWIEVAKLAIPVRDYLPQSLEAKIVAFCDQILHNRAQQSIIFREAPQYDIEVYKQYYTLTYDIVNSVFQRTM